MNDGGPRRADPRRRAGVALIAVGLVCILWGVFHVLNATSQTGRTFAERRGYNEVKATIHERFPGALLRALAGLALAVTGNRLLRRESSSD